ncbi:hypothetical protein CEXT_798071 [Caerostris extrusa]|uniref:Uncharacterized protein n=1 Tax=Caerostris extrusa TaxID=172846 RepID=A0AAV4V7G5_CAEEX|nr:hypothetical protein CEXT_798071 [Caerostris extrusa]
MAEFTAILNLSHLLSDVPVTNGPCNANLYYLDIHSRLLWLTALEDIKKKERNKIEPSEEGERQQQKQKVPTVKTRFICRRKDLFPTMHSSVHFNYSFLFLGVLLRNSLFTTRNR